MFRGTGTAVITPFKDGAVDFGSFRRFLRFQLENGIEALIVLGTTGESPTINESERTKLIRIAVDEAGGKVPVIVGTGTNSTEKTIKSSLKAFDEGADGVLVVVPYYNKPTQEGLYRHFGEIATRVQGPVIIYNVPGRTGANILPDTVIRCLEFNNIVGVKEASGDQYQVDYLISALRSKESDFKVWSGNDDQAFHLCCSGGDGVISVISNVAPMKTSTMIHSILKGDLHIARGLHLELLPLMKALFVESNPIPVKYALSLMNYCQNELRLPLYELSEGNRNVVRKALQESGVL
ncbi:dihydrodipicolinate synthase [Mesotoga prima MesG1.Ag.4.2]|uniref:4-hydroxy-tetrahydrodipicolinate synthase n=1 Tax=Mesotoga prima MesG1.Ag.4.2 TaxID=660470 RepID=I2F4F5_9BACT|nr:4-hydroxy-tetrahydrodipicolinate synthase [Mesotoga prima]AFK06808.1 dihydrodipicolinate synthase [Mesotoga prima MesG1.Ag.4.2]